MEKYNYIIGSGRGGPTRGVSVRGGGDIMGVDEGNLPNCTRYMRGDHMCLIHKEKVMRRNSF